MWLQDSLEKRPVEIQAEYNKSVAQFGHRFEIGDSIAHTSLAHTLLVLNTGLINLINHALSSDSKTRASSKRSLLSLSEVAAADTMNALGQLHARLSVASQLTIPAPVGKTRHSESRRKDTSGRTGGNVGLGNSSPSSTAAKRRPPPALGRGGWVRSKSGSSSVVAAHSARKRSPSKGDSKHRSSKPDLVVLPASSRSDRRPKEQRMSPAAGRQTTPGWSYKSNELQPGNPQEMSGLDRVNPGPRRQPSMLTVPFDFFDTRAGDKVDDGAAPPRPPKIPLHSRPNAHRKPRPPSAATLMTASTKIGEIPEHRWPDRTLSPQERDQRPLPYVVPPRLVESATRKKGRCFKFWRKVGNPTVD